MACGFNSNCGFRVLPRHITVVGTLRQPALNVVRWGNVEAAVHRQSGSLIQAALLSHSPLIVLGTGSGATARAGRDRIGLY